MTEDVLSILNSQKAALEKAVGLLESRYSRLPCDHAASPACMKCNTAYLTATIRKLLAAIDAPTTEQPS